MKKHRLTTLLALLCCTFAATLSLSAQETPSFVPEQLPLIPAPVTIRDNHHAPRDVSTLTTLYVQPEAQNAGAFMQTLFETRYGRKLEVKPYTAFDARDGIGICVVKTTSEAEGYTLNVSDKGIIVTGNTPEGAFRGVCTLDQLFITAEGANATQIPCVTITDAPRFPYRGLMLDPARSFIPIEDVRAFVATMARYKYNVLHLHLSDDQGWRLEMKNPELKKLHEIGSQKNKPEGTRGYYTRDEIKALVAFAQQHYIEIIPEIDIPGHSMSAITPYPELTCEYIRRINQPEENETLEKNKKMRLRIWDDPGVSEALLCAGSPKTYTFYAAVLDEVCELFPSPRMHIGGDEAPTKCWQKCADCQVLMKKQHLANTQALMAYFFEEMNKTLLKHKKTGLYWFEIDVPRYPKNAIMYAWRMGLSPKAIDRAIKEGYSIICAPGEHAYLDYPQNNFDSNNGWMPRTTLQQTYKLDPGYNRPANEQKAILGCEGTLWGEHCKTLARFYYQAYPRALALVEAGWTPMERRRFDNFKIRLKPVLQDMQKRGINVYWPADLYGEKK